MSKVPGPSFFEFAANTHKLIWNRLDYLEEVHRKYGEIVKLPFGVRTSYIIFHPDLFQQVLVSHHKKYWKGRTFEKASGYLGKGLATSEGEEWLTQRRKMNPHLHREALSGLSELMVNNVDKMLDRWDEKRKKGEMIEATTEFQRLAMEIVARALLGAHVPESDINEIIEAFKYALKFTVDRTLNPLDISESLPLPSNIKFKKAMDFLDSVVYRMITEERKRETPSGTLLSMLVYAEDPETGARMTDKQLRDEVLTMFLGGTDTSGNTMSWTMYNLFAHQDIYKKAASEVDAALQGRTPGFMDLANLAYVKRVIEETLRLFPQNYIMSRDNLEDDVIAGYNIPKDSTVFLGVWVAHRRPDFWENAMTFNPDRFLPENLKGRHQQVYIPFGGGPRKCIGFQFAFMEMTFAMSRIVQRFNFEITNFSKIKPTPTWSLWPGPTMDIKVTPR